MNMDILEHWELITGAIYGAFIAGGAFYSLKGLSKRIEHLENKPHTCNHDIEKLEKNVEELNENVHHLEKVDVMIQTKLDSIESGIKDTHARIDQTHALIQNMQNHFIKKGIDQ